MDSKDHFQLIFDLSRDGYVISHGSGGIINSNPAYAEMLGYTAEEIMHVSWRDLTPEKWLQWELDNHGQHLLEHGHTDVYEKEYIRKDGTVFPVEMRAFLLNKPENIGDALIAAFARDISGRKAAENELRLSAERFERWQSSNFIGILQSTATGDIIDANDTMLSMIGYTRQDLESKSLDWNKLTPPEFNHLDLKAIEEAAEKGSWTPFEKEYIHKDGHRVPIRIGGSLFKHDTEQYIVFVVDLTD